MWTRKELKTKAKHAVSGYRYLWAVVVSGLIAFIITLGLNSASGNVFLPLSGIINADKLRDAQGQLPDGTTLSLRSIFETLVGKSNADDAVQLVILSVTIFFTVYLLVLVCIFIVKTLIQLFLVNPFLVSKNLFYVNNRNAMGKVRDLVTSFTRGSYSTIVKTMFMRDLYVGLWSLLFIIPGIIKSYSYFLVPYIIAENPSLPLSRVFEISKKTMKGQKFDLFVLQLSFLGWMILASATFFGLGFVFLDPYMEATYIEFYETMKLKASAESIIKEGELPVTVSTAAEG